MTMHLLPPMYSTTGKRRGKKKWASAEQKRQAEQLEREWQAVVAKHATPVAKKTTATKASKSPHAAISARLAERSTRHIPSLDTGLGNASKAPEKVYTGDKIVGIATMHKSNAVPVFSNEQAQDISKMRRG